MKSSEQMRTVTYMKTNAAELIKEAANSAVIITQNGEAKAVLQDVESYQQQKQALLLLKLVALGEHDVKTGRLLEQEQVFANLLKEHKMNRYRVRWTEEAVNDLTEIVEYIARDSNANAKKIAQQIRSRCALLTSNPQRCHPIYELAEIGVHHYRELLCSPYKVIFRIEGKAVFVLAVLDGRRDFESLLLRKLIRR